MPNHTTGHSQLAQNNGLQYDQFMRPAINLKSRKLTPILTKFVKKYLPRAYPRQICRYCHAQAVLISCHKLSCDAYSHWHSILRFLEMCSERNLAKITPSEGHKSWNTWHEISDISGKYALLALVIIKLSSHTFRDKCNAKPYYWSLSVGAK